MQSQPSGAPDPATAWQPFTWGGVAAFARPAPVMWLAWVVGVALLVGVAAERFVTSAWLPVVDAAVARLPATSHLAQGRLHWPSNTVVELGRTPFLLLRVNLPSTPVPGQTADVEVEASAGELTIGSLFGYGIVPYPATLELDLGRGTVEPLWATWRPYARAAVCGGVVLGVWLSWFGLAFLATPFLRLLAAILRRDVTWTGCWRLAVMALLPGALIVAAGLGLYTSGGFRLVDFVVAFLLGHLFDVLLLAGATWGLPRRVPVPLFGEAVATDPAVPAEADFAPEAPESPEPAPDLPEAALFADPAAATEAYTEGNPFAAPGEEPVPEEQPPSLPADNEPPPAEAPPEPPVEEDGPLNPS